MKDTIPGFVECDTCKEKCYRIWDNMAIKIPEHMKATSSLYNSDTGSNADYIAKRMNKGKRPSGKDKVFF